MIRKYLRVISLLVMISALSISIPMMVRAADENDFSFSVSGNLADNTLTVNIQVQAPSASDGKFSAIYCNFAIDETELASPTNALDMSSMQTSTRGDVIWGTNPFNVCALVINGYSESFTGGTQNFTLQYDVSNLNINDSSQLKMIPVSYNGMQLMAMWEQSPVTTSKSVISSCEIKNSQGSDVHVDIPTSSITDNSNGTAIVTGTVSDGTATLNVVSDQVCTVAYTKDDGATYTRVSAAQADSGYNFVVPEYTDTMKFVVAVKGDLDGDGLVNLDDMGVIASANLSASHQFHEELSALNRCLGDLDGDGLVNLDDMGVIASANLSPTHQFYEAIGW